MDIVFPYKSKAGLKFHVMVVENEKNMQHERADILFKDGATWKWNETFSLQLCFLPTKNFQKFSYLTIYRLTTTGIHFQVW